MPSTMLFQIIKKTRFPHWGETLQLELDSEELSDEAAVTVEVWDWDMVGKNDFLGKVRTFRLDHPALLRDNVFQLLADAPPSFTL